VVPVTDYVLTAGPLWVGVAMLPHLLVALAAVAVALVSLCSSSPVRHEQARALIKDLTRLVDAMWPHRRRR